VIIALIIKSFTAGTKYADLAKKSDVENIKSEIDLKLDKFVRVESFDFEIKAIAVDRTHLNAKIETTLSSIDNNSKLLQEIRDNQLKQIGAEQERKNAENEKRKSLDELKSRIAIANNQTDESISLSKENHTRLNYLEPSIEKLTIKIDKVLENMPKRSEDNKKDR